MIGFLGDIHGDHKALETADKHFVNEGCVAGIQVGDLGWYPWTVPYFNTLQLTLPWYWIDGNHEYYPYLANYTEVTEVVKNLFYVPRGVSLELDGRRILFMGGAGSVDKAYRTAGKDWFPEEDITDEQLARVDMTQNIDILVTHVPPQAVIQRHFDPNELRMFGLDASWRDKNADKIETLWTQLGYPINVSGHMHRSVSGTKFRILNINEQCFL
jgi:predicted phosphodiesterase